MVSILRDITKLGYPEILGRYVKGNWKLDDTLQSKLIAVAFGIAAEIERELISQRTREALAAKKRLGIALGRPKGPGKSKLDPFRPEIEALLANGSTKTFIANRYKVSVSNLSRWLKKGSGKKPFTSCTPLSPPK